MYPSTAATLQSAAAELKQSKRGRPRSLVPSRRDQEIFRRVTVDCQRQADVAADRGISQSRVSQVVRSVRRWLAAGGQGEADVLSALERRRLARCLGQARQEAIYERLIRQADWLEANPKQTTVRTEARRVGPARAASAGPPSEVGPSAERGTEDVECRSSIPLPSGEGAERGEAGEDLQGPQPDTKVVSTVRHGAFHAAHVQLLKAAQRAAIELERLAEREPIPEPAAQMPTDNQLFQALFDVLCDFRRRAEHAGRVTKSDKGTVFIRHILAAVLGRDLGSGIPDDPAVHEAIRVLTGSTAQFCSVGPARAASAGPPSEPPAHSSPIDVAALAGELVPPAGGQEIPNPRLFLGSDERLPPAPPDNVATSVAENSADRRENRQPIAQRPAPASDQEPTSNSPASALPHALPTPAPPPAGSYQFGSFHPPARDPRIAAMFDPWTRDG